MWLAHSGSVSVTSVGLEVAARSPYQHYQQDLTTIRFLNLELLMLAHSHFVPQVSRESFRN